MRFILVPLLVVLACDVGKAQQQKSRDPVDLLQRLAKDSGWQTVSKSKCIETQSTTKSFVPLKLPQKALIEFESISWLGIPQFALGFNQDFSADTYIETWDDTLVGLIGDDFVEFGEVNREFSCRLTLDQDAGLLTYHPSHGNPTSLKLRLPVADKQGLFVLNAGSHLLLKTLRISEWDGKPLPELKPPRGPRVLYKGPSGGDDWEFRRDGKKLRRDQLPHWSTRRGGALVTAADRGTAFYHIDELTAKCELRVLLLKSREDKRFPPVTIGFHEGLPDPQGIRRCRGLTVSASKGAVSVTAGRELVQKAATAAMDLTKRSFLLIRIFRDGERLTAYTADGKCLGSVLESPDGRTGIALHVRNTLPTDVAFISEVTLYEWDGNKPGPLKF